MSLPREVVDEIMRGCPREERLDGTRLFFPPEVGTDPLPEGDKE